MEKKWNYYLKKKYVIVFIVLAVVIGIYNLTPEKTLDVCKDESFIENQPERRALIESMLKQKLLLKIDKHKNYINCFVGRDFYKLTFDQKEGFCDVIYAYYLCEVGGEMIFRISDGYSGKQIGKYGPIYGGLSLD